MGKSTLLRVMAEGCSGRILDLDDLATRNAVAADPATFVAGEQTVCIDDYQKAPVVLDAIKVELNRGSRPGRFVSPGSTRHDALPTAAQALTGRLYQLPVYPLTQGELAGVRENLLGRLLDDAAATVASTPNSATTRSQYIERIVGRVPHRPGGDHACRSGTLDGQLRRFHSRA